MQIRNVFDNIWWCLHSRQVKSKQVSQRSQFYTHRVNCYGSLLLSCIREINHFLKIPIRESRKNSFECLKTQNSILETQASKLNSWFLKPSRIEDWVSSQDCQLTSVQYCRPVRQLQWWSRNQGLWIPSPILKTCTFQKCVKNLTRDCLFFFYSASGFQTGIKRKREEEDDGDLNIDGDDSEEFGKPQYPLELSFLCKPTTSP